jgi:hypothetical protein
MFFCSDCNYSTTTRTNLNIHHRSKKHQNNQIINEITRYDGGGKKLFVCDVCFKEYKHQSSFSRHRKMCMDEFLNKQKYEEAIEKIKTDYEHKLEIEKLKNELDKKDLEIQFKDKASTINNNITNNVKISKIEYLNVNFNNVLDIHTFIDNYRDKYGLTNEQAYTLLENYKNNGINTCISNLVYYLKKSAINQYKELKGQDLEMDNVMLPFILSDMSLREHYEKSVDGSWNKTTTLDNINKIVSITDDHIYKHHQEYMYLNGQQKKRVVNGILKESAYASLPQLNCDFYKSNIDAPLEGETTIAIEDSNAPTEIAVSEGP